jgi:hypothetical protein
MSLGLFLYNTTWTPTEHRTSGSMQQKGIISSSILTTTSATTFFVSLSSSSLDPRFPFHPCCRPASLLGPILDQMPRQQEIRHPLHDLVLVPAVPAHQLPLLDCRLQQHPVQILGRLTWNLLCFFAPGASTFPFCWHNEVCAGRRRRRQRGEAQLSQIWLAPLPFLSFPIDMGTVGFQGCVFTSSATPLSSSHIRRGRMFLRNARLRSVSRISRSASRGWRGNAAGEVLHVLMAQVRKLRVRSFMLLRAKIEAKAEGVRVWNGCVHEAGCAMNFWWGWSWAEIRRG